MIREKIIDACGGYKHTILLTQSGKVYCMGKNEYGQLGSGDEIDKNFPFLIEPKWFNYEKIIQVKAGTDFCVALTEYGNIYTWGIILEDLDFYKRPKKINLINLKNDHVIMIEAGKNDLFILTKNNKIYCCGHNICGELGIGNCRPQSVPLMIDTETYNNEKIVKISAGYRYTMLLTNTGNVYSCGENKSGNLGLGNIDSTNQFQCIGLNRFGNEKVKDIFAGDCSFAITVSGSVYSWGDNWNGQLGLHHIDNQFIPCLVDPQQFEHEKVNKISCSNRSTIFITDSKRFYWFGQPVEKPWNTHDIFKHEKIILFNGNQSGFYNNAHWLIVTKKGKLFTWGDNYYGQLGLNHDDRIKIIGRVDNCLDTTNEKIYKNEAFEDVLFDFC